jgi:hypothetical protein
MRELCSCRQKCAMNIDPTLTHYPKPCGKWPMADSTRHTTLRLRPQNFLFISVMSVGISGLYGPAQAQAQDITVTRTPQQTTVNYSRQDGSVTSRQFNFGPQGTTVRTVPYNSELSAGVWSGLRSTTGSSSDAEAILAIGWQGIQFTADNWHIIEPVFTQASDTVSNAISDTAASAKNWASDATDFFNNGVKALVESASEVSKNINTSKEQCGSSPVVPVAKQQPTNALTGNPFGVQDQSALISLTARFVGYAPPVASYLWPLVIPLQEQVKQYAVVVLDEPIPQSAGQESIERLALASDSSSLRIAGGGNQVLIEGYRYCFSFSKHTEGKTWSVEIQPAE